MNNLLVENIIKAVNNELKNGLLCITIICDFHHYITHKPINIYSDEAKIGIYDNDTYCIMLNNKAIDSIEIVQF